MIIDHGSWIYDLYGIILFASVDGIKFHKVVYERVREEMLPGCVRSLYEILIQRYFFCYKGTFVRELRVFIYHIKEFVFIQIWSKGESAALNRPYFPIA